MRENCRSLTPASTWCSRAWRCDNIYNAGERQTAVREIARVLEPGGRLLILDIRHTNQYAATLREVGLDARSVEGIASRLLTVITFGSLRWGYVIASKK